jgi:hypothetical protein
VVLIVNNKEMLKVDLELADVVTNVGPLFLFSPVELAVLANHVLRIFVILNSSHLELTDSLTVVDIPMAPHFVKFLIDLSVVHNNVTLVGLGEVDLTVFKGALN